MTTVSDDGELTWQLVRVEREVGRRRARDVSARLIAGTRLADAVALLSLVLTWSATRDGASVPGLAVSTWLTSATVVAIALRQVVLAAVAAHGDRQSRRTVLAAAVLGTTGIGLAACTVAPAMRRADQHPVSWAAPASFAVAVFAAAVLTALAGRRIHAAMRSVDLLDGLVRPSPALVRDRLASASVDAARRAHAVPFRTPWSRRGGPSEAIGGFGAARRIATFGVAAAVLGTAAEALVASARPTTTGSTLVLGGSGLPAAAWVAGAVVAAALLGMRRAGGSPLPSLARALLLTLVAFAAGVVTLLTVAGRLQADGLGGATPGPAHWLALGCFAAAAGAALLSVSALCEDVREQRRPPITELTCARERLRELRLAG